MNEKKDLDRLFQEKFKDFEVAPPEFVWGNIQEILQEKKKRRVIPLWFKLSGVAALLVLSGLLATLFFNDNQNPVTNTPAVVLDNNIPTPADASKTAPAGTPVLQSETPLTESTGNASQNQGNSDSNSAVASGNGNTNRQGNTTGANAKGKSSGIKANANSAFPAKNNDAVAQGNTTNTINKANGKRTNANGTTNQDNTVAVLNNTNNQQNDNKKASSSVPVAANQNNNSGINNKAADALAAAKLRTEAKNYAKNPNAQNNLINKNNAANGITPTEGIADANTAATANKNAAGQKQQQNNVNRVTPTEGIAANGTGNASGNNPANAANNTTAADNKNNVIIDRTLPVTQVVAQTTVDSAKVVPENELEKRLQEILKGDKKEDEAVAETKHKNRWNVKPQVAPVFYNSLSSGSPINQQFASNSKSYDNELSIGLGVNYALNDRISIRSGVNSVNLSYATNDIAFYASLNGVTNNIGESKTAGNIVVQNPGDVPSDPLLINGVSNELSTGSMVQKTGYVEIPLEMSYAVVNNKFGIDVIGGISTLFLNQNNVSVVSSTGLSTRVGEAQNLNNVHFSTNVGLGFKYRFWDSFQANFEPMFKYQVNAYSRDAGNFKPYFIGLYTGVSFSF